MFMLDRLILAFIVEPKLDHLMQIVQLVVIGFGRQSRSVFTQPDTLQPRKKRVAGRLNKPTYTLVCSKCHSYLLVLDWRCNVIDAYKSTEARYISFLLLLQRFEWNYARPNHSSFPSLSSSDTDISLDGLH